MFEYKYISVLKVCEMKQENANNQLRFIAEVWIYWTLSILKVLNIQYPRENTSFHLRLVGIAVVKHLRVAANLMINSLELKWNRCFKRVSLLQKEEKLVAGYIEHLTDIEIRRDKRWTDNDRKRAERKQQEYNDIDSCHPLE